MATKKLFQKTFEDWFMSKYENTDESIHSILKNITV
jgi:hypothetical protein